MDKMTIYYTDSYGNKKPVEIRVNQKLTDKSKKHNNTKLKKAIATTAMVLGIGSGIVLSGCSFMNQKNINPTQNSTISILEQKNETTPIEETMETKVEQTETKELSEDLRFNPNSKESIIENAVFLIEEAARCGKELDAEDAVLSVIAANSNKISAGFMGELFGERADQTYTYDMLTDSYLKTCLIQLETMGVVKDNAIAFNMENVFANIEDYEYLNTLRNLTLRFNNSTDENERKQLISELNEIAFKLTTYDSLDISSPAGVLAMLSLDGMRVVTNNMDTPILHDDIRDEMFGEGNYFCGDEKELQTAYSNRVSDLKLDGIKAKLDNAVLVEGKTVILNSIIKTVEEQTKDVQLSDFDVAAEINKILNSYVDETYKNIPVVTVSNIPTDVQPEDKTTSTNEDKTEEKNEEKTDNDEQKEDEIKSDEVEDEETETKEDEEKQEENEKEEVEITPTISNPEVVLPEEPDVEIEEDVIPEPEEEIFENEEEAIENVENEWEKAQTDSNQGSIDGQNYGLQGLPKPSFEGKSQYYINAFNTSYDVYYKIYLDALAQQEELKEENATIVSENETSVENTSDEVEITEEVDNQTVENSTTTLDENGVETTTVTYDLNNLTIAQLEELRIAVVGEVSEVTEETKELIK